jgi:hypothetical protein
MVSVWNFRGYGSSTYLKSRGGIWQVNSFISVRKVFYALRKYEQTKILPEKLSPPPLQESPPVEYKNPSGCETCTIICTCKKSSELNILKNSKWNTPIDFKSKVPPIQKAIPPNLSKNSNWNKPLQFK